MEDTNNEGSPKHFASGEEENWKTQYDGDSGPIDVNYPNMRRFRPSRNFKNPPQPHMCIREKTIDGQELFINVLSWTRIANPNDKNAPIPLFGGMRVPPGSPRSPPLVFAVMASPEVLKQAGRKCPETPERMNLIDLMCEFVEEMNPGLILSRKPEILKDRDLSGELKDVWSAVQALRDRQRTPKTQENLVLYTGFGPPELTNNVPSYEQAQQQQRDTVIQYSNHQPNSAITVDSIDSINSETENMRISPTESSASPSPAAVSTPAPKAGDEVDAAVTSLSQTTVIMGPTVTNTSTTTKLSSATTTNGPVTTAAAPTKKEKESTNHSHLFFPKFRSKSSSNHTADENGDGGKSESSGSNKKGLNFFRRKLSPKNEKPDSDKCDNNKQEILTSSTASKDKDSANGGSANNAKEIHQGEVFK